MGIWRIFPREAPGRRGRLTAAVTFSSRGAQALEKPSQAAECSLGRSSSYFYALGAGPTSRQDLRPSGTNCRCLNDCLQSGRGMPINSLGARAVRRLRLRSCGRGRAPTLKVHPGRNSQGG